MSPQSSDKAAQERQCSNQHEDKGGYLVALECIRAGFVDYVKEQLEKLEIKSNAEFLFKLRYPADAMVEINDEILESWKNAGFDFSADK